MKKKHSQHHHTHNHSIAAHVHHHARSGTIRLAAVIIFNIIITISEFIGGMISGSLALISDAWHNLSDVLSLMLGYAGEKVSESDPTHSYSFGLKRFEVLIALINAVSLMGIGVYIVYEAVARFINPVSIKLSVMLPVAGIGLVGNIFSILFLSKDKNNSLNMKAAFLHMFYDALSSVAVIAAGIVLYATGYLWIDLAISLAIVLMISWSSVQIIQDSLRIFLQGTPSEIDPEDVIESVRTINGVGNIHGLHIWSVSSKEIFLSCHICTDEAPGSINSDDIIKNINAMLEEKFGITHTTIQVENNLICSIDSGECCR